MRKRMRLMITLRSSAVKGQILPDFDEYYLTGFSRLSLLQSAIRLNQRSLWPVLNGYWFGSGYTRDSLLGRRGIDFENPLIDESVKYPTDFCCKPLHIVLCYKFKFCE
jgi:hypothetical protein